MMGGYSVPPMQPMISLGSVDEFKETVRKKIAVNRALAQAIGDRLCVDLEQMLQADLSAPKPPKATPEDLVHAQSRANATRAKIEALRNPDESNQMAMAGAAAMAPILLPDLEHQLEHEEQIISRIQKALENQEPAQ